MFSDNQVLKISGNLDSKTIENALRFALELTDDLTSFTHPTKADVKCVYQITDDGRYCIGKAYNKPENGWKEFSGFDFDLSIISAIICQHLSKQEFNYGNLDGSYEKGFVMKAIPISMGSEDNGIKSPFYGIVEFEPYVCFYGK